MEEEHYTPAQAGRILARTGRPVSERRIRQMLQAGELEGEQSESGRWRIPRRALHTLMEESPRNTRKRNSPGPEERPGVSAEASRSSESVRELLQRVEELSYRLGASESRLELTERAESTAREERDRLRAELEAERAERRRLAEQLQSLQASESPATPAEEAPAPDAHSQERKPEESASVIAMWKRIIFGRRGNR